MIAPPTCWRQPKQNLENSSLGLKSITVAGDLRRGAELVADLALVAEKEVPETSQLRFGELVVHIANEDRLGAALLFATGSERHLDQLRKLAKKKGADPRCERVASEWQSRRCSHGGGNL